MVQLDYSKYLMYHRRCLDLKDDGPMRIIKFCGFLRYYEHNQLKFIVKLLCS